MLVHILSTFQRKYRSSVYELGSPVLTDDDSFRDKDATWAYDLETAILANHPDSEVRVKQTKKITGYMRWKEEHLKDEKRVGKRMEADLSDIWKVSKVKDNKYVQKVNFC